MISSRRRSANALNDVNSVGVQHEEDELPGLQQREHDITAWRSVVLITLFISLTAVVVLVYKLGSATMATHTSVIIFKLPRSGSTWFTELLNK